MNLKLCQYHSICPQIIATRHHCSAWCFLPCDHGLGFCISLLMRELNQIKQYLLVKTRWRHGSRGWSFVKKIALLHVCRTNLSLPTTTPKQSKWSYVLTSPAFSYCRTYNGVSRRLRKLWFSKAVSTNSAYVQLCH